jgi:hypothetical protein
MPQPRLPPSVHRLGNARSAVVNRDRADQFCRTAGPLAQALHDRGLSLRAIGRELLRYRLAARQGGLDRPLGCTAVRRLLLRYRRLNALSQLPAARHSSIAPTPIEPAVSGDRGSNAILAAARGVAGRTDAAGAGPHPLGDPAVAAEPPWW